MRALKHLVAKEVRDLLRDPRILFGVVLLPLLLFPSMGLVLGVGTRAVGERAAAGPLHLALADADGGAYARALTSFLATMPGNKVQPVTPQPLGQLVKALRGYEALVYIPPGFSANITAGLPGEVTLIAFIRELSLPEAFHASRAAQQLAAFKAWLIDTLLREAAPGASPTFLLDPLKLKQLTAFQGSLYGQPPGNLAALAMAQPLAFGPLLVMLIVAQLAATSLAIEKEEKTLEILLSLPVPRTHILAAKLAGISLVAGLATASFLVGWSLYTPSILQEQLQQLQHVTIQLTPTPAGLAVVAAAYFAGILCTATLAMLLAALTQDVRSAQALVGLLIIPLILPSIFIGMAGAMELPLALTLIPFTHAYTALPLALAGQYGKAALGAAYLAAFAAALLLLVARLFATERLLTLRLALRRRPPEGSP